MLPMLFSTHCSSQFQGTCGAFCLRLRAALLRCGGLAGARLNAGSSGDSKATFKGARAACGKAGFTAMRRAGDAGGDAAFAVARAAAGGDVFRGAGTPRGNAAFTRAGVGAASYLRQHTCPWFRDESLVSGVYVRHMSILAPEGMQRRRSNNPLRYSSMMSSWSQIRLPSVMWNLRGRETPIAMPSSALYLDCCQYDGMPIYPHKVKPWHLKAVCRQRNLCHPKATHFISMKQEAHVGLQMATAAAPKGAAGLAGLSSSRAQETLFRRDSGVRGRLPYTAAASSLLFGGYRSTACMHTASEYGAMDSLLCIPHSGFNVSDLRSNIYCFHGIVGHIIPL